MPRIRGALSLVLVLAAIAFPATADLTSITHTKINIPFQPVEETVGPDGTIWILTDKGNLGKFVSGGTYTEFSLPWGTDQFKIPYARNLTVGIDGNVWVIGFNGHVARVTPSGTVTDFKVASAIIFNTAIVNGADGASWFLDRLAPGPGSVGSPVWKMARIDIYGQLTTYDLALNGDNLTGLIRGGDGNLWFIDASKNQVIKFSTVTNAILGSYPIPSPSNESGDNHTTIGPDANIWFTHGTSIDRITPSGTITEFKIPGGAKPAAIAWGSDGNIWFTEPGASKLGTLAASSAKDNGSATITESNASFPNGFELFPLPAGFSAGAKSVTVDEESKRVTTRGSCADATCPGSTTFLYKPTPPDELWILIVGDPTACADISVSVSPTLASNGDTGFDFEVTNRGPGNAGNVQTIINLAAGGGFKVSRAFGRGNDRIVDPSVSTSEDLTRVVANGDLPCHQYYDVFVYSPDAFLSVPTASATAASCCVGDPDTSNNTAASTPPGLGGTPSRGFIEPVPAPPSNVITNPPTRGH